MTASDASTGRKQSLFTRSWSDEANPTTQKAAEEHKSPDLRPMHLCLRLIKTCYVIPSDTIASGTDA